MEPAAKQFLISKVVEEAGVEQVNLSDFEKKMLYFTEESPSLPDIHEINAEFEPNYDLDEYEAKVVTLLKKARTRDVTQSPQTSAMWNDSISALQHEDHYILVFVDRAFPEHRKSLLPTHPLRDYIIYIAVGIAVVLVAIGIAEWSH
jgi:hypothetical protein